MKHLIVCLTLILLAATGRASTVGEITQLVTDGHWRQARQDIAGELAQTNLAFATRQALLFQQDRMTRMALDFRRHGPKPWSRPARWCRRSPTNNSPPGKRPARWNPWMWTEHDGITTAPAEICSASIRKPRNSGPKPSMMMPRCTGQTILKASSRISPKPAGHCICRTGGASPTI